MKLSEEWVHLPSTQLELPKPESLTTPPHHDDDDKSSGVEAEAKTQGTHAVRILEARCLCGEGIVYEERTDTLLFVDIDGKTFHTLQLSPPETRDRPVDSHDQALHTVYSLPRKMGSFGLLQTHKEGTTLPLLCAWEDGFQLYDIVQEKELSPMSQGPDVNPAKQNTRLNDGRVDPTGTRFFCGGYFGEMDHVAMQVFRVEQRDSDGSLVHTPVLDGIQVTNAICFSPNGSRMYFADSPTKRLVSFAYDSNTGTLSDRQLLRHHEPSVESAVPDGACVDSEGYIWNAIYNWGDGSHGVVHRIHPSTGEVTYTVYIPDGTSQITCCCFGGEHRNILFITTAAKTKLDQQPHAGAVYMAKVPFTGINERRLNFSY